MPAAAACLMAEATIFCDLCGQKLADTKMTAEMAIAKPNDKAIPELGHQRMFEGVCPEHGRRIRGFPEEGHSTILESRLKKRFSKVERKAVMRVLERADRKQFQQALHGRYLWDEEDAVAWEAILHDKRHT